MQRLFENWRKYLKEQEEIAVDLPIGSSVRYNIQSGGEISLLNKIPHPFSRKYNFKRSSGLPSVFYFGGPRGLTLDDITVATRKGGIGAPALKKKEAGFYMTRHLDDAEDYAAKNDDGVVYDITLSPAAKIYSYPGDMEPERSWIVNFSEKDWSVFKEDAGMDALYDDTSGYLIVLNKDIIQSFEQRPEPEEEEGDEGHGEEEVGSETII